jgi:hypothetical protein
MATSSAASVVVATAALPPAAALASSASDIAGGGAAAVATAAAVAIDPRAASAPRFRITPRDVARSADRAFAPDATKATGAVARAPEAITASLVDAAHRELPAPRDAFATTDAPEGSRTAFAADAAETDARAEIVSSAEQTPATATIDTGADAAALPAVGAGISSLSDGGLAIVSAPSGARKASSPQAGVDADAATGIRERGRAAATGAADHRAMANGIHAEVDLGEAGRILVHADKMDGSRVDVRLDVDVAQTARALTENARDLAMDLRSDAREARVTVNGPGTHSVSSSTDGGATGGTSSRGGGGDSASSRREGDNREPRDGYAQGNGAADRDAGARASRRARFVL